MITPSLFNNPFSLFNQDFPFSNALRVRPQYNEGFFGLRPFSRDPFFSDFFDQPDPFQGMIRPFLSGSSSVDDMFENFKHKMEEEVKAFEELEKNPPQLEDPEHTSCYMRVLTDDNGHVKVKTMKKTPETEWETRTEEYDRSKSSLENKKNGEDVQIEDGAEQKQQEPQEQQQQVQGSSDSQ